MPLSTYISISVERLNTQTCLVVIYLKNDIGSISDCVNNFKLVLIFSDHLKIWLRGRRPSVVAIDSTISSFECSLLKNNSPLVSVSLCQSFAVI